MGEAGILPGELTVAAWIEREYTTPQGSNGDNNADVIGTVHATNG